MEYLDYYAGITGLVAGITALIVAVATAYRAFRGSVSDKADAMKSYQDMLDKAASDCKQLRTDVAKLQEKELKLRIRIRELERGMNNYKKGIERLVMQLSAHDIKPAWSPSPAEFNAG